MNRDVVQESLEVRPRLFAVAGKIQRSALGPLQLAFRELAECVFEVGVDNLAALLLNQVHQLPEAHTKWPGADQ